MKRGTLWMTGLGFGTVLLLATPAMAQSGQNAAEAMQNEREIRADKVRLAGDITDVRALERELALLDRAHAAGARRDEDRIRQRIHFLLRRETVEARRDLARDRGEVARSGEELRSERLEVSRDANQLNRERAVGTPSAVQDANRDLRLDRHDLRDDRHDLRDDVLDAGANKSRLERQRAILRELREIQPDVRQKKLPAIVRERALYDEFLRIAKEDARASGRELTEDRVERREDRRERRDNRSERQEVR